MERLSPNLQPILALEHKLGNIVVRIDEPAGSDCPLAVVFREPLHFLEAEEAGLISNQVHSWQSSDPHYPSEAGFVCLRTKHALVGPLKC